jgi:hypothetical protein
LLQAFKQFPERLNWGIGFWATLGGEGAEAVKRNDEAAKQGGL